MSKHAVRLGLYGCGNRTRSLLNSVNREGEYEVAALYDVREEAMETVAGKYGGRICRSSDELVSSEDVEAYIISLDPFAHPAAFYETLEDRKPIYLEKPIAPDAEEAHRMMMKAEQEKIPVYVGLIYRYTPSVAGIRKFMDENDPGRVFCLQYEWFQNAETEIINVKNSADPDNFRLRISQIPYHCCHALDALRFLGGEVKSVRARSLKWMEWDYVTPDEVIAVLEFQSGAMGLFHYSGVCLRAQKYPGRIHAENYVIEFTPFCAYEVCWRLQIRSEKEDGSADCRAYYNANIGPWTFNFVRNKATTAAMRDFLEAVRSGSPMKVTIEDGYRAAEIAGAIQKSYESQERVELPLAF